MIQPNDDNYDDKIDPVPLFCSSYERFIQSRNLLIDAWNFRSCDGVEGSMLRGARIFILGLYIDFARLLGWIWKI